jgi:hypothetical protein
MGVSLGDGLRCVSMLVIRLGLVANSGGAYVIPVPGSSQTLSSVGFCESVATARVVRMRTRKAPQLPSSTGSVEATFRSAWFWIGAVLGCYCISILWLGDLILVPQYVLLAAPSGLFHLVGIPEFENGLTVVDRILMHHRLPLVMLLAAHSVFWWMLLAYISQRKLMHRADLMKVGWTLILVLVANLVGCATMKYST